MKEALVEKSGLFFLYLVHQIYRKFDASSLKIVERITLHVSDDTGRIAMLENRTFGTPANDNNTVPSLTRYIYSNHLQSASLELNHLAEIVSYEEYHPYGTTSYQAMNASIQAVAKRYRYTGKERDEESGLYYHGARYYVPWLCRWVSVDPLENKYAGMSPYNYSFNNPVMFNDPSGADPYKYNPPSTVDATRVDPSPLQKWAPPEGYAGVELEEVVIKENPEMVPLETRDGPILSYGERMENAGALRQEVFVNKVNSEREQMLKNMYLDEPHISADQNGNGVTWTRRGLAWQEYQANEAWGESLRSGNTGTAVGTIFGGREGGMKGAVVGDVLMSFASVGTPYGKVEPVRQVEGRYIPDTEGKSYNFSAGPSKNVALGLRLNQNLAFQEKASLFNSDGTLKQEVINKSIPIMPVEALGNVHLKNALMTKGNLSDWNKMSYTTGGNTGIDVHFYYNSSTKETYLEYDYKVKFGRNYFPTTSLPKQ